MHATLRGRFLALLPAFVLLAGAMMASPALAATFVYVGNAESTRSTCSSSTGRPAT